MTEGYEHASDFLMAIIAEEVPLSGSPMAEQNMQRIIAMTADNDTLIAPGRH